MSNKLTKSEVASLGGRTMAPLIKEKSLIEYYKNPKYCKFCNSILEVKNNEKPSITRTRSFCNKSCAGKLNGKLFPKRKKIIKETIKYEKFSYINNLTKKELFSSTKTWQHARSIICKHARYIFSLSSNTKTCQICGYSSHIQVCHKIPVSKFSDESLISNINSITNLIGLCPNHHWELDHGILMLNS